MNQDVYGIILAAGKGTRFKSEGKNKTVALFQNKPLISYGVTLFESVTAQVYVVVGAYSDSVKEALQGVPVQYAVQQEQLGTGHALNVAIEQMEKDGNIPSHVVVGYGDHMMFYTKGIVNELLTLHKEKNAAVSFLTTHYEDPNTLAWGRIERDEDGNVKDIIEQKDATEEQRNITEVNPGFYCFSYDFLKKYGIELHKSEVTGELYLTEYIAIAKQHNLPIATLAVPFKHVGIGINSPAELEKSQQLFSTTHQ